MEKAQHERVTIVALLNLIRLLGTELVAGTHRDDVGRLERAVRRKIDRIAVPGLPPDVVQGGLAEARSLVEQTLVLIRARAEETRRPNKRRLMN
ncbi:hypothetical protein JNW90_13315 [Micromonospora sp. STR1s_5]|nr:hypothetical protein [Micromonospora sp. STR1s_5]